jgi:lysophospholipase L1-like esterase
LRLRPRAFDLKSPPVNSIRYASIVSAAAIAAALVVWLMPRNVIDEHRHIRQLVLHFTFERSDDPVIILGDSIVEASTLPRAVCGHPVVNAGLNGASTASDLGTWLGAALGGKPAAMIVVALGTNDALMAASPREFTSRYGALLDQLAKLSPRLAVLGIPTVEARLRMSEAMRDEAMKTIDGLNAVLPDIATRHGAAFASLPAMPAPHTVDGVHLDANGYQVWDKAVMQAAARICS